MAVDRVCMLVRRDGFLNLEPFRGAGYPAYLLLMGMEVWWVQIRPLIFALTENSV